MKKEKKSFFETSEGFFAPFFSSFILLHTHLFHIYARTVFGRRSKKRRSCEMKKKNECVDNNNTIKWPKCHITCMQLLR